MRWKVEISWNSVDFKSSFHPASFLSLNVLYHSLENLLIWHSFQLLRWLPASEYLSFYGRLILTRFYWTLTKWTLSTFSTSSDKKEHGYRLNSISICTVNFWSRCFWSMIRSLSTEGTWNSSTADVTKNIRRLIAAIEIQAPEIVP